jgi:putative MATE family efflux protein
MAKVAARFLVSFSKIGQCKRCCLKQRLHTCFAQSHSHPSHLAQPTLRQAIQPAHNRAHKRERGSRPLLCNSLASQPKAGETPACSDTRLAHTLGNRMTQTTLEKPQHSQRPSEQHTSQQILTEGSLKDAIMHLSLPLFAATVMMAVTTLCDIFVAGRLGPIEQASIGIVFQAQYALIIMNIGLEQGAIAVISQLWGAREKERAVAAAQATLLTALVFGALATVVGSLYADRLLLLLGARPEVVICGAAYMRIFIMSQMALSGLFAINTMFRAIGNGRIPFISWSCMTILVVVGDLFFCLGPPHFGLAGIGLAWNIATLVGVAICFQALSKSELGNCLNLTKNSLNNLKEWSMRLLKIGLPASVQDITWMLFNFVIFIVLSHLEHPTACEAAWSLGLRIDEVFLIMPIIALGMAASAIVGQNVGAQQFVRAHQAGWQITRIAITFILVVGSCEFAGASWIANLMSVDPVVCQYTARFLQVAAITDLSYAIRKILFCSMEGAGYTRAPMIASMQCMLFLRIPAAWILSINFHMGLDGCLWSIVIGSFVNAVQAIYLYQKGDWRRRVV